MENIEYLQVNYDLYGATEKNKNKMLQDNYHRLDVIYTQFLTYAREYKDVLSEYLQAYYKAKTLTDTKYPMYVYYHKQTLTAGNVFDYPRLSDLKNCWQYSTMANSYFRLEENRLKLLAKLAVLKNNIENCMVRLKTIENNVSKNYSHSDSYVDSTKEKVITKKKVLEKAARVQDKIECDLTRITYFDNVPSIEKVAEMNIELNQAKKEYNLMKNASNKIIL